MSTVASAMARRNCGRVDTAPERQLPGQSRRVLGGLDCKPRDWHQLSVLAEPRFHIVVADPHAMRLATERQLARLEFVARAIPQGCGAASMSESLE